MNPPTLADLKPNNLCLGKTPAEKGVGVRGDSAFSRSVAPLAVAREGKKAGGQGGCSVSPLPGHPEVLWYPHNSPNPINSCPILGRFLLPPLGKEVREVGMAGAGCRKGGSSQ